MEQLFLAVGLVVVVAAIALVLRRRAHPDAPTQAGATAPQQLDRADFERPDAEWLVAVFSSATCSTCADVVRKAAVLATADVAVQDVEYTARRDLHRRYAIDAVPIVVIADREGVVRRSFVGPVTATDLWAGVAACREPGSTPPC
jgi:thioredoxin-related protein